eukprot:m.22641 g.22641  ORF g.22641 m.22641 type:complete len:238 (-) comp13875_c0_seq1:412-1125(-)
MLNLKLTTCGAVITMMIGMLISPHGCEAGDPSSSWMSYAEFAAGDIITLMNVTVQVPAKPVKEGASPSFWFGLQTATGTGALIQPILAWSQLKDGEYAIFHEVFDWNNEVDSRSPKSYQVFPGDTLTQSVAYRSEDNSYDMYIASKNTGESIAWNYKLEAAQKVAETTAFIVVEHAPFFCKEFPPNGNVTFTDIVVEVNYKRVASPAWVAKQENPKCDSKAMLISNNTIAIAWNASG